MNKTLSILLTIVLIALYSCNSTKTPPTATSVGDDTTSSSLSFEGQITYQYIYEERTDQVSNQQAKLFLGDQQIYTIKGNKYKSELNGFGKVTSYYPGGDTLFNRFNGMHGLIGMDISTNPDTIIDYKIEEGVETILGIKCDLLTINTRAGSIAYYYNKTIKASPADFSNHEFGFWKFCIEKTHSLPLKQITDVKDNYTEIIAVDIKEMAIDAAVFLVPDLPRIVLPEK